MNSIRKKYAYVLKSIKKDHTLNPKYYNLNNKNYVISGGTRGVGLSIAKSLSSLGANIILLGKTITPNPKLEGTLKTATEEVKNANLNKNNKVISIQCDIRSYDNIIDTFSKINNEFEYLNGCILNASALCLNPTLKQTYKEINLMSNININGTFFVGQQTIQRMRENEHNNIITISPPIEMIKEQEWWKNHLYYTMSKYNMSIMAKFWNEEFNHISINTLWPRTTLDTAPVRNILGGEEMVNISRHPDIMGEAAKHIICADPKLCTGKNFIDDEVLVSLDKNVEKYRINKNIKEFDLMPDFFC
jgi:citronellol/citronellal dehydrogenase